MLFQKCSIPHRFKKRVFAPDFERSVDLRGWLDKFVLVDISSSQCACVWSSLFCGHIGIIHSYNTSYWFSLLVAWFAWFYTRCGKEVSLLPLAPLRLPKQIDSHRKVVAINASDTTLPFLSLDTLPEFPPLQSATNIYAYEIPLWLQSSGTHLQESSAVSCPGPAHVGRQLFV